jgi:hypothetical protein
MTMTMTMTMTMGRQADVFMHVLLVFGFFCLHFLPFFFFFLLWMFVYCWCCSFLFWLRASEQAVKSEPPFLTDTT